MVGKGVVGPELWLTASLDFAIDFMYSRTLPLLLNLEDRVQILPTLRY